MVQEISERTFQSVATRECTRAETKERIKNEGLFARPFFILAVVDQRFHIVTKNHLDFVSVDQLFNHPGTKLGMIDDITELKLRFDRVSLRL